MYCVYVVYACVCACVYVKLQFELKTQAEISKRTKQTYLITETGKNIGILIVNADQNLQKIAQSY